jgi:uncharacterized protein (DUF3084 family)
MIIPRAMPDCWIAHGIDTTAEPIIVFQQLKTITVDDAFPSPEPALDQSEQLTNFLERVLQQKEIGINDMCRWSEEALACLRGQVLVASSKSRVILVTIVVLVVRLW